ncbi:MAG TPA: arginase family protein [Edaphobacter sp.]|nr:arginase family protein [Edaphobacter sp.]
MNLNRREFAKMASFAAISGSLEDETPSLSGAISLILAPSNLGLRPNENGSQPGAWRAPQVLMNAGLAAAVSATDVLSLKRPAYELEAQFGTTIRNGLSIRAFSFELGEKVHEVLRSGRFPLVVGGDCSILLGCLYGARLAGGRGLVHIDGHSDFFHPGNYDTANRLSSAAGMDLALASGRGELLLTHWLEIGRPLVQDADVVQVGERDAEGPDFNESYGDIVRTGIMQITIQGVLAEGVDNTARRVLTRLESRELDNVWLHVDCDVLDQTVMPAVDSPGRPGFNFQQLGILINELCHSGRIVGADFTIYDPERDPHGKYSKLLVDCIARGISNRRLEWGPAQ